MSKNLNLLSRELKTEMLVSVLRKERFTVPFIIVSDKEYHFSTTNYEDNRSTRNIPKEEFSMMFDGVEHSFKGSTERCCIQWKMDKDKNMKLDLGDVLVADFKSNRLFHVSEYKLSSSHKIVQKQVLELINGEDGLLTKNASEKDIPDSAIWYRPSDYAPSSIKKSVCYAVKAKDSKDLLDFYKNVCHNILEESLLGLAIGRGEKVEKKDILKLAPRIGSVTGASINLGKCNVAVIKETFDKESLTDGIGFMDSQKAADCMNSFGLIKYGIDFCLTAEDVAGMEIQARPGSSKVKITVMDRKHFKTLADGKEIIHGNLDTADILLDKNGVKAEINWEDITFEYLASSHSKSDAYTSKQLLEKVIYCQYKEGNIVKVKIEEYIVDKMIKDFEEKIAKVDEREGDLSNDYIAEELAAIKAEYPTSRKDNRESIANTMANNINKLRFKDHELDFTATLKPDIAIIFEKRLIEKGEIVISDKRYFGRKIIMIKYPAVGGEEYMSAKVVSQKEIIDRAERLYNKEKITKEQYDCLFDYYNDLRPGCAVLPAIREQINSCAGLDFDFDHASIYCGETIVNALWNKEQLVNISNNKNNNGKRGRIEVKKMDDKILITGATVVSEAFRLYTKMGNKSIGAITNSSETCLLALIEALKGNMTPCINIIKTWRHKVEKDNIDIKKYVGLKQGIVINLTPEEVPVLIENMLAVDLNCNEDVIKVFKDLFVVFRLYQERTIDSTKTAEKVKVLVEVLLAAKGVQPVELIDKGINEIPVIERVLKEKEHAKEKIKEVGVYDLYFDDAFSRIQDELIEAANFAIMDLYEETPTFEAMDSCFVNSINIIFQGMCKTGYFDKALETIKNCMSIYYTLTKERSESMKLVESSFSSQESIDAKKRDIRKSYDFKYKELGIAMSDSYDLCFGEYCDEIGEDNVEYVEYHKAVFLFAGCMVKNGEISWKVSKAQQNMFPEYLKYMLSIAFNKNVNEGDRTYVVQEMPIKRLAYKDDLKDLAKGYGCLKIDRGVCVDMRQQAQFAFKTTKDITGYVDLKVDDNDEVKAVYKKEIKLDDECASDDYYYAVFKISENDEEKLFNICKNHVDLTKLDKELNKTCNIENQFEFENIFVENLIVSSPFKRTISVLVKYREDN